MRKFILTSEGEQSESLKEYDRVLALSKTQAGPYAYVKTWFLNKYPKYNEQLEEKAETKPNLKLVENN